MKQYTGVIIAAVIVLAFGIAGRFGVPIAEDFQQLLVGILLGAGGGAFAAAKGRPTNGG